MISDKECYVYIYLPGETEAVTAGRFVISESSAGEKIGQFVYGRSYLERKEAVPIDPVELILSDKVYKTGLMGGVFGAIRDSAPDLWGRTLIERYLKRTDLSEMDYLLNSPDDRIGALSFGPDKSPCSFIKEYNKSIDLEQLQRIANNITNIDSPDDPLKNRTEELLLIGTSMGGARPKAVISDKDALWVAKFAHPSDRYDMAVTEHVMLRLAKECGINTAESRTVQVAGKNILLVKRFDREKSHEKCRDGFQRHRMISALTVVRGEDTAMSRDKWSYVYVAEELRRFSAEPVKDAQELFKRMAFNALITNNDDHPRNHAFFARDVWRLAPAYDLTPSPMSSLERRDLAMICGSYGRYANINNLISESRRFMLEPDDAKELIMSMADYISNNWYQTARQAGLSVQDCETIRPAFVYPGFFLKL